jgi:hypothetical protein
MYIKQNEFIHKLERELKIRVPVLSEWKFTRGARIAGASVDILATAKLKGQTYKFCIEIRPAGYPQYIREGIAKLEIFASQDRSAYPIIAVPLISERGKGICNEHNINYFDLGGNARIACGGIFINTEGRERPKEDMPLNRSIFSPKASRIAKMILDKPSANWSQKEICQHTGLSKGLVSRIISRMLETGYISENDKKLSLVNFDDLFSAFVDSEMKRREKKRAYYVWTQNPQKLMGSLAGKFLQKNIKYAFTQEAGASLVAPFTSFEIVTVYVESLDKFPEKVVTASRADRGFNLMVIEAPDQDIFASAHSKRGMNVVSNLQLYADLKKNPLRGEKQAELILALIRKGL